MKDFQKILLGHEIFRSMISWTTIFFFEKFVKPSPAPPTYLMYTPLCQPGYKVIMHSPLGP